jgi:lipopolysaccharide export system protein LptA
MIACVQVRISKVYGALIAAAVLCMSSATSADPLAGLGGDRMNLRADKLEVDIGQGSALLTGNVEMSRGDLRVTCPKLELRFDNTPHVVWLKGSGGVSADIRGVHAEAPEVEADLTHQSLELRGGVRLARGNGWLQAERAVIDLPTAKVTLTQVKGSIPLPR